MSKSMTYDGVKFDRASIVIAIATAMLLVVGMVYFLGVQNTFAVAPSDYGLKEGDVVSAAGSDDPDVYIVNEMGFKRLFLNPVIFGFYGHLGGFAAVKNVSPATRDAFGTSGLFRNCETNDQKVYGVETTGEDVGMLHWVNTSGAQAVADDPNFFKKVFCVNNNEFNWYAQGTAYTSVSQVPSYSRVPGATPAPVAGNLSVSLAPDNPAAQTLTLNAYGVGVMALRFSGTGEVSELSFKRGGAGDTADYDNLYIYDGARRLTGGRSPSSADGTVTFINLKSTVAGTKDLWLVADYSATAGNVNNWTLTGAKLASGTVTGFPIMSNNFTVSGASSGTLDVDKIGSVPNPKVGQKNAHISEFKITANTEAAMIKRVQLINGETMKSSDMTNLRLEVNSVKVADGSMTSDGYAVFDFGSGYNILKGDSKIFKMYGDLTGKKDEKIAFYLENKTDVLGVGDQFGFGMKVTLDANFDDKTNTHVLTLQGGVLTIAFNGPNATNVGTDTSDTVLARYSFTAATDIEVKKMGIVLCKDTGNNNAYNDAADTSGGWSDVLDIKVVDEDTGQVVVGPADGSKFETSEATGCPNSATGASKIFTDTFDLNGGKTRNFKVTGDIKTSTADGTGVGLVSGDGIKVVLDGYGESDMVTISGDVAVMKYSGTNTAVDDSDIVPNTDLGGNTMGIQSSSLTVGLAGSPKSVSYVKGASGVEAVGFTFAAALASDLKVTDIKLTAYVADDPAATTLFIGVGTGVDANLSVGNLVSAVKLFDGDTGALISDTPSNSSLNTSTGTVTYNNLSWTIPAGATKRLLVKTNLSSNSTSGASDIFSFDIDAAADVTALDSAGKTVNGTADPNGATIPTVITTVKNSGNIKVTLGTNSPLAKGNSKYWGQTDTEFTHLKVRATDEAFFIETLNIYSADTKADVTNNVQTVKVRYTTEAGASTNPITYTTKTGTLNSIASVSFGFTGADRPFIPKDSSVDLVILGDMKTKANGATSEVNFSLDFSGTATDEFRAVGKGSGTVIEGNDTTDDDTNAQAGENLYVYRVFPEITQESLAASAPTGTKDVLKFTIKAHGLTDSNLLFDDPSSVAFKFEAVASGGADTALTINLYDNGNGDLLASTSVSAIQITPTTNSSVSFTDWEKDVTIAGGSQKTFRVEVAFQNFPDKNDYFQLVLRDEAGVLIYVDGARSGEDQQVNNVADVFKLLPMNGPIFVTP